MARLAGKVAIVVGGARGIGAETVRQFLAEGATVHSADVRETEVADHPRLRHSIVDATSESQVIGLTRDVVQLEGKIDVLFCNVGIHLSKPLAETTLDDYERIMAVNVRSAFLAIRETLPSMLAQKSGSIIVTSSNGGVMGRPGDPVYNASKHALVGLVKSLAVAHAHQGIRVNTVNPGAIDTDMLRGLAPELNREAETVMATTTPAARIGSPAEVAMAVVFLASDESRFINGVAIPIDGGKAAGVMPGDRYRSDFELSEQRWSESVKA